MALGMFEHATYAAGHLSLLAGDVLVLFSDGVTEAENASGVPFGDAGLEQIVGEHWWKDLRTLGTSVLKAVEAHAHGTKIADDLTVLALRRPMPLPPGVAVGQ
jgi:sigma-B regulation protein RsbU (phosphoserine phosphatase)